MTPKSEHEDDMSMEEILASIRKFVTDSPPEEPNKQRVYKGDLKESVVIPPAGHAVHRSQEENYPPQSINRQSSISPLQYEPDILELKSPISPTRSNPGSLAEWGDSPPSVRTPAQTDQEESVMTLTNPLDTKKVERPSRFPVKTPQPSEQDESLSSSHALAASASSLSRLAQASKTALHKKTSNLADQRDLTLDQLIQDMIRPMIRQWIDTHLPSLVEEMVAKEIKRITSHLR
eukprot:TRINITY_DN1083_c0_g1_i2.p1 TRINITY_DN1083_c0_g1~~TRINITY_DN1083_c0_g1_i2.p1  ORF type:complete len:234 (-),score=14.10 TRINITY_DN1083_c0_g1_i2:892-1593(-)